MSKDNRSSVNPFTGKSHFDIINDDDFLDESYTTYYNDLRQFQLLDDTPNGQILFSIASRLINAVETYLASIGRSDYTQNYYDWEVHLANSDVVNAYCMPGGKILVYDGILSIANSEDTLAFILGHEMAHALLDHSRTRLSTQKAKNAITTAGWLGGIGLSLLGFGEIGYLAQTASNLANIGSEFLLIQPFSRGHELEADRLGMQIINWAGYDIRGIPAFWQKMSQLSSNEFDFFSTHPADSKRIAAMKEMVAEIYGGDAKEPTLIEGTKICPQCGKQVLDGDKFCTKCGAKLENRYCTNCGSLIQSGDNFCTNCGNRID